MQGGDVRLRLQATQNITDCSRRGRHPRNKGGAKLTQDQVDLIRTSTRTDKDLAAALGVHRMTISDIRCNKTWVA